MTGDGEKRIVVRDMVLQDPRRPDEHREPDVWRVFLSSTYADLIDHRKSVLDKLQQLGTFTVAMEDFGARDDRPKNEVLRLIRESTDIFVGIYARRYGFVPPGDATSITQQEYEAAVERGLPRFIYLLDDAYDWPPEAIEAGPPAELLAAFKKRLKADQIIEKFTTADALAGSVVADIGRHLAGLKRLDAELPGLVHEPAPEWSSKARETPWRYKVAAFDLDGTLLRGGDFVFSWQAVWESLGFGPAVQAELKRDYRKRAGRGSRVERIEAYRDWCEKATAYYKRRGLKREQLSALAARLSLTGNCRETLGKLREAGLTTAIISGGIDTFLEDAFSDYREYVDFAFINHLTFGADGTVQGVVASAYDFEGKAEALELVCERVGCGLDEAVFVGDRFNDEPALLRAGLGIAYPAGDDLVDTAATFSVAEDDLLSIVPRILVE